MHSALRPLPLVAVSALVAGCAAQGPFPSLAPRAVERDLAGSDQPLPPCLPGAGPAEAAESVAPPAPPQSDPTLRARIGQLLSQAREGDRAFDAAMNAAEPVVSAAGPSGSESWIAAQLAVSRAEAARTPTSTALSDLTALALEETARLGHPEDQRVIEAAIGTVQALADRQVARLEALKASLSDL